MDRRVFVSALAGAVAGRAQIQYRPYHRCLLDYTAALAAAFRERRENALASTRTPEEIRQRQQWVRETFWKLAGGQPDRTPLNVRTRGEFARPGYKCEKLTFESQAGLVVPALLYLPVRGTPPYPGVLFQPGHSLNGKAAEPYQKCCQALAQLGYVVLTFDPMGQGERTYYPEPGKLTTRLGSADEEHSRPGRLMLLVGETATRMQTWDAVRALDVLAAHPLVDPKRLASTGQSGGGTLTMFLAAVDDRLACAAVSCGNTENFVCADFNPPGSTDDAEQNFVRGSELGFERWDTLYPLAPRPLWIGVSARDWFGTYSPQYLSNGREEWKKLQRIYTRLGRPEELEWYETAAPHALAHDLRIRIYGFFERCFRGRSGPVAEPPVSAEPDSVLQVGATGSVMRDFSSDTPLNLLRAPSRTGHNPRWRELLHASLPARGLAASIVGRANAERCTIEGVEIRSAENVTVPAWVFKPMRDAGDRVLMALEPRGRNGRWREGDLWHQLAAGGWTVCAFDVRGLGDMWPEVGRGNPFYTKPHNEEEAWAWASLMLGRPLLGQRVTDILAVAEAYRGKSRTVLAALGHTTVPALCAAALDPRIDLLYTSGGLRSWTSLLSAEDYSEPLANFLPNVLQHTDLPEIRKFLGSRLKEGTAWDFNTLQSL